jgi:asparagine synthase (glutamine-hydrolysing)
MCGFIGFIGKNNIKEIFAANSDSIKDRGIFSDSAIYEDEAYGYARLPTDAVSNNKLNQIRKGDAHFLYNGLITNILDLHDLFSIGAGVSRHSDTLTLRYGFEKYGKRFLERCRGMFAFAHITRDAITLCRDTVGIKPLYYCFDKNIFGFCSEMKGLLRNTGARIHELLPGELLVYDRKHNRIAKDILSYKPYKKYTAADLRVCLENSVVPPAKRYLRQSKRNIALLMSGGLDSSIMLKILRDNLEKKYRKRVSVFCLGVPGSSDVAIARRLTRSLGFGFTKVSPYAHRETRRILPNVVYKTESRYARVARVALLQDALAKKIQSMGIHVVLSGEGADELFFGYPRFIDGLTHREIRRMFRLFFRTVFPGTLLQRYDRIFARRQIEGRVPFLDQELIALSRHYKTSALIGIFKGVLFSKLPLRHLAKELGLMPYVYMRPKTTMTRGATNKENRSGRGGYLERAGVPFERAVRKIYSRQFPQNRIDPEIETRADEAVMARQHQKRKSNMPRTGVAFNENK